MADQLTQILYRSYRTINGSEPEAGTELDQIVAAARRNNERDGLTGALLCTDTTFTQVLEGPSISLETIFERICCDLRHRRVQLLEMTNPRKRAFDGYPMGLIRGPAVSAPAHPNGFSQPRPDVMSSAIHSIRNQLIKSAAGQSR